MRERHRRLLAIALLGLASLGTPLPAQTPPAKLAAFLREHVGLDSARVAAIERAEPVVKILDTQNSRDVAVFGIIRVDVPREFYVARLQDFPTSLTAPTRPHFGIFHDPAIAADVAAATVPEQDVAQLKDCRPGACAAKLPATDMGKIHDQIDWSAPDSRSQLNAYLRQRLVQYVTDYRTRGDSALVVYDDRGGVHASDAFAALLAQSPYVYEDIPSLRQYLAGYPHARLEGAREIIFWADDSTGGARPTLSANHLVLYAPPESPDAVVLAVKQLYASHYFEGGFDLMAIVDRPSEPGTAGVYLVVLRRLRFDQLQSGGVLNIRGHVVGKLRDQMRIDLERQKAVTARAFQGR